MAHFAQLNDNNEVIQVLVVNNDYLKDENGNEVEELGRAHMEAVHGGRWIQTSYNNNFRVRYAGTRFTYNETLDAFIPPKPYPSWILNNSTLDWEPPIPRPNDENLYEWNEETQSWDLLEFPTE